MIAPMTFPIEIMLRGDERVYTESITHAAEASTWTDVDVRHVLEQMLVAIGQVVSPGRSDEAVSLRGLSWIVSPYEGGVVIALEIHSASAVAGPIPIDRASLDASIARVLTGAAPTSTIH
jgi:hypothetical protein